MWRIVILLTIKQLGYGLTPVYLIYYTYTIQLVHIREE